MQNLGFLEALEAMAWWDLSVHVLVFKNTAQIYPLLEQAINVGAIQGPAACLRPMLISQAGQHYHWSLNLPGPF